MKKLYTFLAIQIIGCIPAFSQISFVADITEGCKPLSVNFTNNSTDPNAVHFNWYFGDGQSATDVVDTSYIYTNPGSYTVYLYAYDNSWNYIDYNYATITVIGGVNNINIFPDSACPGDLISFGYYYNYDSLFWDFGDGNTSTDANPSHSYNAVGDYVIKLAVATYCGTDTVFDTARVRNTVIPDANFTVSPTVACPGESVNLFSWNTHQSYSWQTSNGDTSTLMNPVFTFPVAGTYYLTFTSTNNCSNSASKTDSVVIDTVMAFPSYYALSASDTIACPGEYIDFYGPNSSTYYIWNYGDGTPNDTTNYSSSNHAFSQVGNYNVTVKVFNNCGNDTTLSLSFNVTNNKGFPNWVSMDSYSPACPGELVFIYGPYGFQSYIWDFGDGSPIDTSLYEYQYHAYDTVGVYNASVRVFNTCGNDTLLTTQVVIDSIAPFSSNVYLNSSAQEACPGENISFYTSSGFVAYVWNYGDGSPLDSTTNDYSSHIYSTVGQYNVSVKIYNSCGNDTTLFMTINIGNNVGLPSWLSLYTGSQTVCPNDEVYFGVQGGYLAYVWDMGDGSPKDSTTQDNYNYMFSSIGTYTVSVKIYNYCGNDTTLTKTITVNNTTGFPGGLMISNPSVVCPNSNVSMYAPYGYSSYVWNYGDGSPTDSTSQYYAEHTYSNVGNYTISVNITNNCGVDSLFTSAISVSTTAPFPQPLYLSSNTPVTCPGDVQSFYTSYGGFVNYEWNFGDGTPLINTDYSSSNHIFSTVGNYVVSVKITNNCGNDTTLTMNYTVSNNATFPNYIQINSDTIACPNQYINFNAPYGYQSYEWNFGDGTPVSFSPYEWANHQFLSIGDYMVSVKIKNNCGNDTTLQTTVHVVGTSPFPSNTQITVYNSPFCPNDFVNMEAPYGYKNYFWDFGDGTPVDSNYNYSNVSHQYNAVGNYNVSLTIKNYCDNDTTISATVNVVNNAGFNNLYLMASDTLVCPGRTIHFDAPYGNSKYIWNFNDGSPIDTVLSYNNTTHSFSAAGTYLVQLVLVNNCGEDTTLSVSINVNNNLGFINGASLYSNQASACPTESIIFQASGGYMSYIWNMGDGSAPDSTSNPYKIKSFSSVGTYLVSVKIYNYCGKDTTLTMSVSVSDSIGFPSFLNPLNTWPQQVCPNEPVYIDAPSGFASYSWDFGDNTSAVGGYYTQHKYITVGIYPISVTITNYCGLDTTLYDTIKVVDNSPPPATLSMWSNPQVACPGDIISFGTYNGFVSYYWNFGDGDTVTTTGSKVNHSFQNPGSYVVSVKVTNGCGLTKTVTMNISINGNAPVQNFSLSTIPVSPVCKGDNVFFDVNNTLNSYQFSWNFGDGNTAATIGNGTTHQFASNGTYTVTVTATNGCGNSLSKTIQIAVTDSAAPILQANSFGLVGGGTNAGCPGDVVVFYTWGTANCYWNFGDGNDGIATEQIIGGGGFPVTIIKHKYNAAGTYNVFVVVTNECGNSDTGFVSINVANNQLVNGGLFVEPSTSALGYTTCQPIKFIGTGGASYEWNFGDGVILNSVSPTVSHSYSQQGSYTVILKVTNACGYTATFTELIKVNGIGGPVVAVASQQNVSCSGGSNGVVTLSASGNPPFLYNWGFTANNQTTATATGLKSGTYNVTVTDSLGCSVVNPVSVIQPVAIAVTVTSNAATCGMSDGSISLSTGGGVSPYNYSWSNGTTNSFLNNISAGTYSVTVTDSSGCAKNMNATVSNSGGPTVIASLANVNCYGGNNGSINISVGGGTSPYSYLWSNGGVTKDATGLAAGTYTLTVSDAASCFSIISKTITQPDTILLSTSAQSANCGKFDGSATVAVNGGKTPYSYSWSSGGTNATQTGLPAGTHEVTVTDANGCSSVAFAVVNSANTPNIAAVVSNVSCNGMNNGSINLSVTGGTNPYAYSWSNGSNTKNISSLTPGAYTLILQDASGCIAIRNYTITQPAILTDSVITINATCGNNDGTATVVASGGNTPYAYSWSDGQTNANATGLSVGTIYVTITDAKGCNKTDSSSVTVTSLPQDICLVTVDSTSTKNIVVWQKPVTGNISHYNVYREIAGVFSKIASVPYDSLSAYRDTTNGVNPQITSYKYKISAVDTCGNESVLSAYHKTLHLTKNVGTSGEVNLIWDGYVGFSFNYYRILRDSTSTGNFQVLDSVGTSNFTYTDLTPPSGIVDYLIEVVHFGGPCLATKAAENHNSSRSNVASKIPPAPLTVSINSVNATGGQCNGTATANATGGQTPYTYQWNTSPVQTSQTATGLCAGTYTVIVTDANSATVTDSIVIIQTGTSLNATTSVTDATQGNCDGTATVTPSGGQSPYSYQWNTSPVQTNQTATGLCAGNYSVTVTDSNNSTITVTATVGTQPGILSNANVLKDVLIYPNPNLGVFTIEISEIEKNKETTELSIYNVLGELVYQSKIIDQKSTITLFAAGVYYLRMVSGQEIVNKKVIVE